MPKGKRSELAAGLFVIIALGATLGVVTWLGAANIFTPARGRAFFYVNEKDGSTGLKVGNVVQITDMDIGRIAGIRHVPADHRTLYEIEISTAGLEIHSDALGRVAAGLVGDSRLIIVSRGSDDKPLADENNPAPITGGLDSAIAQMSESIDQLNKFIASEFDRKKPAGLLAKIHTIADNISATTDTLAKIAANLKPETEPENKKSMILQVRETVSNVRDTSADLKAMTGDAKPKVGKMLTSASNTVERLEKYSKEDIAQIFATLRKANDKILAIANDFAAVSDTTKKIIVLNRDNIDTMIDNMTQVSATLKATAEEIRANPWRLIRKPTKEELHTYGILTAATAFSQGASSLDQAINKLKNLDPKMFKTDDPQIQQIRAHLDQSFKNFKEVEDALWREMQAPPG